MCDASASRAGFVVVVLLLYSQLIMLVAYTIDDVDAFVSQGQKEFGVVAGVDNKSPFAWSEYFSGRYKWSGIYIKYWTNFGDAESDIECLVYSLVVDDAITVC